MPDYSDGRAPYGLWPVTAITVARGWRHGHNPNLDLAFLTVAAVHGRQVQAATGGLAMGFNLGYDQTIEAVAYNNGNIEPVRCATRSFRFRTGQVEFLCGGFHDGTSGAPWVAGDDPGNGAGTLVGVLGGYEGGGVYQWASYSPYFGSALRAVYQMAELRSAPSPEATAPSPGPEHATAALAARGFYGRALRLTGLRGPWCRTSRPAGRPAAPGGRRPGP